MSHHDYLMSRAIEGQDYPFYAIIMAAYRKADSDNQRKLFRAFPNTVEELTARYNAPGGVLESDVPQTYSHAGDVELTLTPDEAAYEEEKLAAKIRPPRE